MKIIPMFAVVVIIFMAGTSHAQEERLVQSQPIAHSGGTDKCGCHYNRKTGEYHCHTRKQRGGDCPA